jgi:hypothetical protein
VNEILQQKGDIVVSGKLFAQKDPEIGDMRRNRRRKDQMAAENNEKCTDFTVIN